MRLLHHPEHGHEDGDMRGEKPAPGARRFIPTKERAGNDDEKYRADDRGPGQMAKIKQHGRDRRESKRPPWPPQIMAQDIERLEDALPKRKRDQVGRRRPDPLDL